jgi:phytanoyl-CoA hydroxylase
MGLSDGEKSRFEADGYVVRPRLFGLDTVRQIQNEIQDLQERMAAEAPAGVGVSWEASDDPERPDLIRQLMHSEVVSPDLNTMLRSDAMVDIVSGLIGPEVSLYHSKLLMKAANDGTAIP